MNNYIYLIFIVCTSYVNAFSQKITQPDTAYFEINHTLKTYFIQSKQKKNWSDIHFNANDSLPKSKGIPVQITQRYKYISKKSFAPFLLGADDIFYANASYFQWLKKVNVTRPFQSTVIGKIHTELTFNQESVKELFHLLMAFEIIQTYTHLYAKVTITQILEEEDFIQITYLAKDHICTSKCGDSIVIFKLQFNRQTNEISLLKNEN